MTGVTHPPRRLPKAARRLPLASSRGCASVPIGALPRWCGTGGRSVADVEPLGPKLAEGRDSEIFEHGPTRVLRRARDGRSLVGEAEVMRHVREHGYPVPRVFDAGEGWLVMERLVGTDMLAGLRRTPRGVAAAGKLLADLHRRLGAISAP